MGGTVRGGPLVSAQLIETLGVGGAERLAVQIAAARAEAGDRSHLYVTGGPGPLSDTVPPEVTLRHLGLERASVKNPAAFAASLMKGRALLLDHLRRDGVEVVQTHLPGANFWGLLLRRTGGVSAVPTIHNNREFDYGDADHWLRARFRRGAYRMMIRSCPAVVAVSELVRDSMAEQLGLSPAERERMAVVPNGVPLPQPLGPEARRELRERFGADEETPLIVAAGRHTPQKNFGTLIEAAGILRGQGRRLRLVIAGDGELRAGHADAVRRAGLDDTVLLPGNLSDLGRVLQAADVFVLPSLWEGLPLVLLEAMAAGCAVVGTRIAGVVEVLRDGENGRLVAPGEAAPLAAVMAELAAAPDTRARLARAARADVEARYSFRRVAQDLGDLYLRIARGATHPTPRGTP